MNITVIGTGYVGLVCGSCLADLGHKVTCIDINVSKIRALQEGKIPFFEPGLEEKIKKGVLNHKLNFTNSYKVGCKNNIFFLCLDTPSLKSGAADLSKVFSAVDSIIKNISSDSIVINKSTVPLGTTKKIEKKFLKAKDYIIDVCSNPEFLREGTAIKDFMDPERIIIGSKSESVISIMKKIYHPINKKRNKKIFMSVESAELTKYAANCFLATKISFMNEISILAETHGGNIHEIREGIGSDSRIGSSFLYAGLGFGGSCFPKDLKALIYEQKKLNLKPGLVENTLKINQRQLEVFYKKITHFYKNQLSQTNLFIWGLSFKPNTDDIRESVAIKLIKKLSPKVNSLTLYDPLAIANSKKALSNLSNVKFTRNQYSNFHKANGLIICTETEDYADPIISELQKLKDKVIFDGRNILDKNKIEANNLLYQGIGI